MKKADCNTIRAAAELLRADAEAIKESHTVSGAWPPDEAEALREYNLLRRLAAQLDRIATREESKHPH